MSKLEKFLKESKLPEEAKQLIQEAWDDEKLAIGAEIRNEMKERYQADVKQIVEGMDSLIKDVIKEEMKPVYDEKRKLVEDRVKIRSALGNFSDFANGVLAEEVKQMRTECQDVNETLQRFIGFSNTVLAEEIKEFHTEKRQLVEQRVKLISEGHRKIDEAKQNFIKRASATSAKFIEESMRSEFRNLRADLQEAKQNMFGRKIFEAFAGEFMQTQFKENTIISKLNESIKSKESEVLKTKLALQESNKVAQDNLRKIRIMEDNQKRTAVLSDLMKTLSPDNKRVMETLLNSTPTELLKEDFNKYIKTVLNNSNSRATSSTAVNNNKSTIVESKIVTGNRPAFKDEDEEVDDALLKELARNAGLSEK